MNKTIKVDWKLYLGIIVSLIVIGFMGLYESYKGGKENIVNQVQENYYRICDDFFMDYIEIGEDKGTELVIGCEFINEKNQSRLWTSYIKLKR